MGTLVNKRISGFLLALVVVSLVVAIALGFLFGPGNPVPWVLMAVLFLVPVAHSRIVARRFIAWNDDYSVGIAALDEDHRRLLHLINNLQTAAHYPTGEAYERQALDELVDYTRTHFEREEVLMSELGYPGFEEHKRQHEAMIQKVEQFLEAYRKDPAGTIEEMVQFLKQWLLNHIAGTDQQYSAFLRSKGVS